VSAVPRPRPAHVTLRPPHVGALVAAAAYAAAAFAMYQLVAPALSREAVREETAAAAPATTGLSLGPEALTLRAIAGRAKTSAYVVEGAGGAHGTAFLGWVNPQSRASFFLTARSVVAGVLATGVSQVYVKQGNRFWPARIFREDENTGLAVLRVGGAVFDRPLWQHPGDRAKLARDKRAVVVPAGTEAAFGEGLVTANAGRFSLRTSAEQIHLGAPVVADDGRVAGVVVELSPNGDNQIAPVGAACRQIRSC
jgi:hypothetical protein